MIRYQRAALALPAVMILGACASTSFISTWKAPDAQPVNYQGQKIIAMVASPNQANRRAAEQSLAQELTNRGAIGVPAYSIIPDNEIKDKDKAKAAFEKTGASGAVVMQLVGKEKEVSGQGPSVYGGPMYGGFYGGWYGWGWGMNAYSPGYVRTDTIVSIETLVYSLKQDKLIWAGTSKTTNPERADTMMKELVGAAANEMKKAGLLSAAK
jgi:hypothetical protein